jgi:hypothetical protein
MQLSKNDVEAICEKHTKHRLEVFMLKLNHTVPEEKMNERVKELEKNEYQYECGYYYGLLKGLKMGGVEVTDEVLTV